MTDSLQDVVAFLLGEGPLDGVWFGEKPVGERGQYWWRKHLRAASRSALAAPVVSDEMVERCVTAYMVHPDNSVTRKLIRSMLIAALSPGRSGEVDHGL